MSDLGFMEKMQAAGLQRALAYLDSDPWENIPKIINWMIKLDREEKNM